MLRLLSGGKKTGLLIVSADQEQGTLRLQRGVLVHAAVGRRLAGEDAVLDLFGWKEGQISFVPEEKSVTPNVRRELDALILEGLRVGESRHRMHEAVPSERVVFQWGAGPADGSAPVSMGAAAWRVLRLLDGVRDVRALADTARMTRADVTRLLFELLEAGLIERVEPLKALRAQQQGLFGGKEAAEIDERVEADWRRILRFAAGIHRVEVRSPVGKSATIAASFRAGLGGDVQLPRGFLSELGAREGDEVQVRPVG